MNTRPFGTSGRPVSVITYGAMTIGKDDVRARVAPSLLQALESGINSVDTAAAYGNSEEVVGQTLREWRGETPFLATKILPGDFKGWSRFVPIQQTFTRDGIRRSVENSLSRLGVERIDFVQLHQWHYLWTFDPEWRDTFIELRTEGKIGAFGFSTQDHEADAALQAISEGLVDGVQVIFNAFESRPLNSLLPLAARKGVAVIARGILDHGGLTDVMTDERLRAHAHLAKAPAETYLQRREKLREAFGDSSIPLSQQAIRFALTPPSVTTLTLPLHRAEYLRDALAAASLGPLPEEVMDRIRHGHKWTRNFWEADPTSGPA